MGLHVQRKLDDQIKKNKNKEKERHIYVIIILPPDFYRLMCIRSGTELEALSVLNMVFQTVKRYVKFLNSIFW